MRSPIRREHEYKSFSYVAIGRIEELRQIGVTDKEISIGACATHAQVVAKLGQLPDCQGLVMAAAGAANPAIRNVATIGGNLCAVKFPASDFLPALLSAGAKIELQSPAGIERLTIELFLERRSSLGPGALLRRVIVHRTSAGSAHVRLPLRKAGDYPVAIVSLSARFTSKDRIEDVRLAVGSVEPVARRWPRLEVELAGRPLDADRAYELAAAHSGDFHGREAVGAPGWYRAQVLPTLVRRAVQVLQTRP